MSHILKNKNLEIQIDLPAENYNFSRFDWTGNIVSVMSTMKDLVEKMIFVIEIVLMSNLLFHSLVQLIVVV